jgi:hypothetical protein
MKQIKNINEMKDFLNKLGDDENARIAYFEKFARITARKGKAGETIATVLQDGTQETKNTVKKDGDMIVTNPNGEEYIVDAETFVKKYEDDGKGQFKPKGNPQKFIQTTEDISFPAPWDKNEVMNIKAGGWLNITEYGKPENVYGVAEQEFNDTYRLTLPSQEEERFAKLASYELMGMDKCPNPYAIEMMDEETRKAYDKFKEKSSVEGSRENILQGMNNWGGFERIKSQQNWFKPKEAEMER